MHLCDLTSATKYWTEENSSALSFIKFWQRYLASVIRSVLGLGGLA